MKCREIAIIQSKKKAIAIIPSKKKAIAIIPSKKKAIATIPSKKKAIGSSELQSSGASKVPRWSREELNKFAGLLTQLFLQQNRRKIDWSKIVEQFHGRSPHACGQHYYKRFYEDFGIQDEKSSQRMSISGAFGAGQGEVAGLGEEDDQMNNSN